MLLSHIDPITGDLLRPFPPIQRLSLHGCQTLPSYIYPCLLSALPGLTHLVYIPTARRMSSTDAFFRISALPKSTLTDYDPSIQKVVYAICTLVIVVESVEEQLYHFYLIIPLRRISKVSIFVLTTSLITPLILEMFHSSYRH